MCRCAASADTAVNFIFPNMVLNRSGPLLLTNAVRPTGPTTCAVRFDWFLDPAVAEQKDLIDRVRPSCPTVKPQRPIINPTPASQLEVEHHTACSCESRRLCGWLFVNDKQRPYRQGETPRRRLICYNIVPLVLLSYGRHLYLYEPLNGSGLVANVVFGQ